MSAGQYVTQMPYTQQQVLVHNVTCFALLNNIACNVIRVYTKCELTIGVHVHDYQMNANTPIWLVSKRLLNNYISNLSGDNKIKFFSIDMLLGVNIVNYFAKRFLAVELIPCCDLCLSSVNARYLVTLKFQIILRFQNN